MRLLFRFAETIRTFIASRAGFVLILGIFTISSAWIALASLYPMAFDEEFHYGLIGIYAGSLLPFGITHTSDMAQYGSATADASYLFHYLLSFPYRVLDFFSLNNETIIVTLRFINIALVTLALVVFRRAFIEAGISRAVTHVALALVCSIPVFTLLAAHINYDNLLLLIIAWCVLLIVRLTNAVRAGKTLPLKESILLAVAVLIGMSVKYSFLPLALAMFIWLIWLVTVSYRRHKQTVTTQLISYKSEWRSLPRRPRYLLIGLAALSMFFASHYLTSMLTYGSPIPSCERVFSEAECTAYGPWNRNKNLEADKPLSFTPLSFPAYMTREWFPGMTQRLAFAVAGKTNGFETRLPMPALVITYVTLSLIGLAALIVQTVRRRTPWIAAFTALLTVVYVGVLAFQLYGDYVDTAEPVAINGRYLLPLLPMVAVALIHAIRTLMRQIDSRIIATVTAVVMLLVVTCGGGVLTYIIQAEPHWFWSGFGQSTHASMQTFFERIVLPYRY